VPRTARGDVAKGDRLTAEIFHSHCPDVADPGSWVPADDADVYLPLEMVIGPRGGGAGDLFQVLVATPRAMQVRRHRGGPGNAAERRVLLVHEYDWPTIRARIEAAVDSCQADDWAGLCSLLAERFHWEYQGYR